MYQHFKENPNFIVLKMQMSIFIIVIINCVFIYVFIHLQINISKPFWCLKSIPRQVFCINSNLIVFKPCKVIYFSICYYLYYYLGMYTPSNHHFKAFPVSNINSKTSFLYQLFKENSNVIVLKPCKLINLFFDFHYYVY